ncbi:MAG: PorP/SprF family type IX secretion system membrane protein [Bacteroidetes bacterium]|nr:PorP/SprF family type IX secretion system membrane protein [Bacteroidota bacterium]
MNDNSGHVALKSTQFVFSGAYHRNINNHLLHGGLQVGFMHRVVDFSDITFPAQWDPSLGQYNPLLSSGAEDGDRLSYLDVGMGFIWQKKYGKLTPEAGFSLYHLNNPKESFYGADTRLPMKIGFSAAVKYDISQSFILQPRVLVLNQAKAKDYIAGSDFGYILAPNASGVRQVNAGVYLRNTLAGNTDAFIIMGGVVFRNFQIGISYDLNISPLKSFTNSRGAFELTLIYRSISTVLNTFTIPCERF